MRSDTVGPGESGTLERRRTGTLASSLRSWQCEQESSAPSHWGTGQFERLGFSTFDLDSNLQLAQRASDPTLPCRWRSSCGSHLETRPAPGPSTPPSGSSSPEKDLVPAEPKPSPPPPVQTQPPPWGHRPMVPLPRSAPVGPASVCISEPQTVHPPGTAPASPPPYAGLQRPGGHPELCCLSYPVPTPTMTRK